MKTKVVILLIIGAIFFTGIGVYAGTQIYAKNIIFTPSNENFNVDNVEDAINYLFENSTYELEIEKGLPQTTYGTNGTTNYGITLEGLTVGKKYLLFVKNGINASATNFTVKNNLSTTGKLIYTMNDYNSIKTTSGAYPAWSVEVYSFIADKTSITCNVSLTNSVNGWVYLQALELK